MENSLPSVKIYGLAIKCITWLSVRLNLQTKDEKRMNNVYVLNTGYHCWNYLQMIATEVKIDR